jgi:acyl-CoA hydrolase
MPSHFRTVLAVLAMLAATACGPPHAALPAGATVLALGDSLTYGTGATPETSYPVFLAAATKWNVVNAGVAGNTAAEGCARLPDLLAEHRPALVLVFLGGNDFLRRQPVATLTAGLADCVRETKAAGVPMVLFAVPKFDLTGLTDAAVFATFANEHRVGWLTPGLGKLLADEMKRADPVHLNANGYRALAANVAAELRRLGYFAR